MTEASPDIISQYKKEDTYVLINEYDPDLMTIKVKLPSLVDWYAQFLGYTPTWEEAIKYVDGYGLEPDEQYFRYQEIPHKLKVINATIRKKKGDQKGKTITLTDVYKELDSNRTFYKNEIDFVKRDIKRRYHGYWFFNNGKPTYLDGWYYFYLNWWDIANTERVDGLPEHRNSDRKLSHFARYCYTTKEAYYRFRVLYRELGRDKIEYFNVRQQMDDFCISLQGKGLTYVIDGDRPLEDGSPHPGFVIEKDRRTVYGFAQPKRRRRGATSLAACIAYLIVTEQRLRHGGMQALNDENATKDVYLDKLIRPWKKIPFWHKPAHDGSSTPKDRLNFQFPADRTQLGAGNEAQSHDGWIEPRAANERAFDGTKLHAIIRDEGGKIDGYVYDLIEWWSITKKCLSQGFDIHGLGMIPSTVGEMDTGGGRQYQKLIEMSKFDDRDKNGQTTSGLLVIMEPSYDCLDGHVDRYGYPVIDDPPIPVLGSNGKWIKEGAKTKLQNSRDQKAKNGDHQEFIADLRDFPFTLREAMTKGSRSSGIDTKILRKRAGEIRFGRNIPNFIKPRRGNLQWVSDFGGDVRWEDDPEGKFLMSQRPDETFCNKRIFDPDTKMWSPDPIACNKFIIGADPFMFDAKDVIGTRKSNGAITGFRHRDNVLDGEEKDRAEWSSEKFVFTYSIRSEDKDEYVEDVLKACVYYSSFVYPEMNVPIVAELFRKWGYAGYLLHDTDEYGVKLPTPGRKVNSQAGTKNEIFADIMTHVRNYGQWENHVELIEEWMNIDGPSDMTNFDLFAASGMCFLGRKSQYPTMYHDQGKSVGFENSPFQEFSC